MGGGWTHGLGVGVALAAAARVGSAADAGPPVTSVRVGLEAPWSATPVALEAFEYAAELRDELFFWHVADALAALSSGPLWADAFKDAPAPQTAAVLDAVRGYAVRSGSAGVSGALDLALSLRASNPRLQAYRTLSDDAWAGAGAAVDDADVENQGGDGRCAAGGGDAAAKGSDLPPCSWVHYQGRAYVSAAALTRDIKAGCLGGHATGRDATDTFTFDHVHPSSKGLSMGMAETAILYGTPLGDGKGGAFTDLHAALVAQAEEGRVRYVLRPHSPTNASLGCAVPGEAGAHLALQSYGVELAIKSMEYTAIDEKTDRGGGGVSAAAELEGEDAAAAVAFDWGPDFAALLGPGKRLEEAVASMPTEGPELADFGVKATRCILAADDPLRMARDVSHNLPFVAGAINSTDLGEMQAKWADDSAAPPAESVILNGGLALAVDRSGSLYSLLSLLTSELNTHTALTGQLGLSGALASGLMRKALLSFASKSAKTVRVDTRGEGLTLWVNDLETDTMYSQWNERLDTLRMASTTQLQSLQVKLNLVHAQIVMDPSASGIPGIRAMASLSQIVRTGFAARMGLLLVSGKTMDKLKTLHRRDPSFFEPSWSEWEKEGCRALLQGGEEFGMEVDPALQFAAFAAFFRDQTTVKRGSTMMGDKGEITFISTYVQVVFRSFQMGLRSPNAVLSVEDVQEAFVTAYTSVFRNTDSAGAKKTMAGILKGEKYQCRAVAASYFVARIGFVAEDFPLISINGALSHGGLEHLNYYIGYLMFSELQRLQTMAKENVLVMPPGDKQGESMADNVWRSLAPLTRYSRLVFEEEKEIDDANGDASKGDQAAEKAAQEEARASAFSNIGRELLGANPVPGVGYFRVGGARDDTLDSAVPEMTMLLCLDANIAGGRDLLSAAVRFAKSSVAEDSDTIKSFRTRLAVLQNPGPGSTFSEILDDALGASLGDPNSIDLDTLDLSGAPGTPSGQARVRPQQALCTGPLGLKPGENAVVANGRVVRLGAPGSTAVPFEAEDFDLLARYEYVLRAKPVLDYIEGWVAQEAKSASSTAQNSATGVVEECAQKLSALVSVVASRNARAVNHKLVSSISSNRGSSKTLSMFGPLQAKGDGALSFEAVLDPLSPTAQTVLPLLELMHDVFNASTTVWLAPKRDLSSVPLRSYFRYVGALDSFKSPFGDRPVAKFSNFPTNLGQTLTMNVKAPDDWLIESTSVMPNVDLDNIVLEKVGDAESGVVATYRIEALVVTGEASDLSESENTPFYMRNYNVAPQGMQLTMQRGQFPRVDTVVMHNYGYFQLKAQMPGVHTVSVKEGRSRDIYFIVAALDRNNKVVSGRATESSDGSALGGATAQIAVIDFTSQSIRLQVVRRPGMEEANVLDTAVLPVVSAGGLSAMWQGVSGWLGFGKNGDGVLAPGGPRKPSEDFALDVDDGSYAPEYVHVFSIASGHLYERFLKIMIQSVLKNTERPVKFWFIKNYLSPGFLDFVPKMAERYTFKYEFVTYAWPEWLRKQTEKQRLIWAYKILFLDVIFPLQLDKVIYIDADQIVRGDLGEVWDMDLHGAPYAYTPLCYPPIENPDTWGYRFWEQGFWKNHLSMMNKPYHISAFYVVDLKRFRETSAGDTLRAIYQQLSADPNSLANLDQDLPNFAQDRVPIFSLPSEWLWCESWCNEASKAKAKTIDLCNNPKTKEPKLAGARRIVDEWPAYDKTAEELELEISGYKSN